MVLLLMAICALMLSPVGAALVRRFDGLTVGTSGLTCSGNVTCGDATNDITTVAGNCTVNGITTMSSNATVSGILTANGNVQLGDNATADSVTSTSPITANSNLTVAGVTALNGNATIGDNTADTLAVAGNVTLNSEATVTSTLTASGNVALNGSAITIGNASTDVATCTGRLVLRTLGSDPLDGTPGNRPAGTVNEIAVYSGVVYLCTNADTPTWVRVGPPAA